VNEVVSLASQMFENECEFLQGLGEEEATTNAYFYEARRRMTMLVILVGRDRGSSKQ